MRRGPVLLAAGALLVAISLPVAAHANEVNADPQVSGDGTVVIENAISLSDGYVVVHRVNETGGPGEPIGHASLSQYVFRQPFEVSIDDDAWADWGDNREIWIVFHEEAGGEGFDPDEDPIEYSFGSIVGDRIVLGKGTGETSVIAERFDPQQTRNDTVTIERVALAEPGTLAIRTDDDNRSIVGQTRLDAGVHRNVSVTLESGTFGPDNRERPLLATLYPATDGAVSAADQPIRVDGEPVETGFTVERLGPLDTTGDADANATAVPTTTGTETPLVVTPTPSPEPTGTTTAPDPATTSAAPGTTTAASGATGPGFGPVATIVGLSLVVALLAHRRRQTDE